MTSLTEQWWEAGARGELLYRGCDGCRHRSFVARTHCPECGQAMSWHAAAGLGVVHASTRVHRSTVTAAGRPAPYTIGYVRFDEGFMMLATLDDGLRTGDRVRVEFVAAGTRAVPFCRRAGA